MTVQLQVSLNDGASQEIERLAHRVDLLPGMLDDIGGALASSTQQRFLDQQGPDGTSWQGHSDATIAHRGSGADILRDLNHLFDTVSHKLVDRTQVAVGVNRVYARIHQLGGEAGRGRKVKIPARPYLGVSDDDAGEIKQIVLEHLEGG